MASYSKFITNDHLDLMLSNLLLWTFVILSTHNQPSLAAASGSVLSIHLILYYIFLLKMGSFLQKGSSAYIMQYPVHTIEMKRLR